MPELPEVTTMVNGLRKTVLKSTILDVWTDSKKNIKNTSFDSFKKGIKNSKIEKIQRKGKVIIFFLSNEKILIVHPKMSGHFLFGKWERKDDKWVSTDKAMQDPMNRFIHFIFFLDKGMLAFSDLRKFARIELWDDIQQAEILKEIGPDALDISFKELEEILKTNKKIKQLLMDQKSIAGIGNIYSDEILFKSRIKPFRKANSLKLKEKKLLFKSIKEILKKGVELTGSSISDFRKINGKKGNFQEITKIYQKKRCPRCNSPVIRQKIGGRTTHFCDKCQK